MTHWAQSLAAQWIAGADRFGAVFCGENEGIIEWKARSWLENGKTNSNIDQKNNGSE